MPAPRGRRRAVLLAAALVLGVGPLTAGCALTKPAALRTPADDTWWSAHGTVVLQLMVEAQDVAVPMADVPGYEDKCKTLGATVAEARKLPHMPSDKLDFALQTAIELFNDAVDNCAKSFTSGVRLNSVDEATTYRLNAMNSASFGQVRLRTILSVYGFPADGLPTVSTTTTPSGPATSLAPPAPETSPAPTTVAPTT